MQGAGCPYKNLADSLREKKGVPFATAKLESANGDGDYVEFFRGKDFARYFRANPEKMNDLVQPIRPGRTEEDQIRDLMHFFVNKGLVLKNDRKYKRPKPGKPRLVKWPRTIEMSRDQSWDESVFYSWRYDRPTSFWYYIGTAAIPVMVILACLFPLAPWWMRMAFIYSLMGLLSVLLGIIAIRYVLYCLFWVVTGYSFWLFPNMMSDEVGVMDAFLPVVSFEKPEASGAGASQPLFQQATAQRGGAGYDPTGGKAHASQKLREEFEAEQAARIMKAQAEAAARGEEYVEVEPEVFVPPHPDDLVDLDEDEEVKKDEL
eukprot:gene14774-20823_t